MDYNQKFIPEGWNGISKVFSLDELNMASINGNIIEAKVTKCDSNYNLYLFFHVLYFLFLLTLFYQVA